MFYIFCPLPEAICQYSCILTVNYNICDLFDLGLKGCRGKGNVDLGLCGEFKPFLNVLGSSAFKISRY